MNWKIAPNKLPENEQIVQIYVDDIIKRAVYKDSEKYFEEIESNTIFSAKEQSFPIWWMEVSSPETKSDKREFADNNTFG